MFAFLTDYARLTHVALKLLRRAKRLVSPSLRQKLPLSARMLLALSADPFTKPQKRGEALAEVLQKLGPAYIKLGQFLATRPDIIGIRLAQDLSCLKDSLPPFDKALAYQSIQNEWGEDTMRLFPELGPAIAAASVAQVHRLDTPDGPRAIKILRPKIEPLILRELRALKRGAATLEAIIPASRRLEPKAFIQTIGDSMRKELDLRMEAAAADEFAHIAAIDGFFHIPAVDWQRTGTRVLALEWIDGVPLTRKAALEGVDRPALAHCLNRGFLASALDHGVFHADIHEGNIMVLSEEAAAKTGTRMALVDFGIMGRIDRAQRRFLAEVLHGFLERDYTRIARVHFESGYVPANRDPSEFAHALRSIGEPIFGVPVDQVSMGHILIRLFDTTREFGMHLRPELVLLQKTMVQVEGVARTIDPQHDIWASARPIVDRWVSQEFGPKGIARSAKDTLFRAGQEITRLPGLLDRLERVADTLLTPMPAPRHTQWQAWLIGALIIGALALGLWQVSMQGWL